ncbi:MAG TPA: PAC2 family protein [Actinomycetota bacterium]
MGIFQFEHDPPPPLVAPVLVVALEGWVDAGAAATTAAATIARDGEPFARLDPDALFDYRARRPTLEIVDGAIKSLEWPELTVTRVNAGGRDVLVMTGPEPDQRWRELNAATIEFALRCGVVLFVALGSIGLGVPHTRPTPVMGTATPSSLLPPDQPRPEGILRVPAACVSTLENAFIQHGIPAVGFWARTPYYLSSFDQAALALVDRLGSHLTLSFDTRPLERAVDDERTQLEAIMGARPDVEEHVRQLEKASEEQQGIFRVPSGDEIASEIERYLRDRRKDAD